MKICYCLNNIQNFGGIEKITKLKAQLIAEEKGFETYIIVTDLKKKCPSLDLCEKVNLINLDVNYGDINANNLFLYLVKLLQKKYIHFSKLRKKLKEIKPDIVVSTGMSEKILMPLIKGDFKKIWELHFCAHKNRIENSNKNFFYRKIYSFIDKIGALISSHYYDCIVTLTKEDKELNWVNNKKVIIIPNFHTIQTTTLASLENKKVLAIGRLTPQKNFSSLIKAFCLVVKKYPDWELDIYGDGELKEQLAQEIHKNELTNNVFLKGNTNQIKEKLQEYSIFVLSSIYEGMPIAMLEAISSGLPVVSYNCPTGPKDIIIDTECGFLVPMNNEETLSQKILYLIDNADERKRMGFEAFKRSKDFHAEKIIQEWLNLYCYLNENCLLSQ